MINPIKIVIHDFPKVFSVAMLTYTQSFKKLKSNSFFYLKSLCFIKSFTSNKAFSLLLVKDKSEVVTASKLNGKLLTAASKQSLHNTENVINAKLNFKSNIDTRAKIVTELNSIVAIFLKWQDRELETWNDVETLTCGEFILREII